jgi:hypothetical protein
MEGRNIGKKRTVEQARIKIKKKKLKMSRGERDVME